MRRLILSAVFFIFGLSFFSSKAQIISTIAGNGQIGYVGDGGQATAAEITWPFGITFDNSNNLYISDYNNCIRKVSSSGIITTIAGNGIAGYSGDGGQATAAEVNVPYGIELDASGNIYFADCGNCVLRKINTLGNIDRFAGNGGPGFSGDGGQATDAELNSPTGIALDVSGNIYLADCLNNRVRKVNTSGVISTIVGNGIAGYSGDGGQATAAEIDSIIGIAINSSGILFIGDSKSNCIRRVNTNGVISTIAGVGIAGYSGDGGQATAAKLSYPASLSLDGVGNIYIADSYNSVIRKVNTAGIINTIAGNGVAGYSGDGGQATAAKLNNPSFVILDASSNIIFSDTYNNRIRMIGNPSATNDITAEAPIAVVYPNPSNGVFNISFEQDKPCKINLYDIFGQEVYSEGFNSKRVQINLENKTAGIYLYRATGENGEILGSGKLLLTK